METRKWDFLSVLGETINERFESLYCRLAKIVEEDLNDCRWVTLIASPEFTSFFETASKFDNSSINCSMGDISCVGFLSTVKVNFCVYKMSNMPQNQAILIGNGKSVCLEIDNFI